MQAMTLTRRTPSSFCKSFHWVLCDVDWLCGETTVRRLCEGFHTNQLPLTVGSVWKASFKRFLSFPPFFIYPGQTKWERKSELETEGAEESQAEAKWVQPIPKCFCVSTANPDVGLLVIGQHQHTHTQPGLFSTVQKIPDSHSIRW